MKTKLLLVLFLCSTIFVYAQTSHELAEKYLKERGELVFTFTANSKDEIKQLSKIVSFDHGQDKNNPLTIRAIANEQDFEKFLSFNLSFTVPKELNEPKQVEMFNSKVHKKQGVAAKNAAYTLSFPLEAYPSYTQYVAQMNEFVSNHSDIARLVSIGTTSGSGSSGYSGGAHELLFIVLSDNVDIREQEPRLMYTSSIHGDELAGYPSMLNLIDHFITAYESTGDSDHTRVKNLLDDSEIWINPLANPDGTFRTTNSNVNSSIRGNAYGIDMNRNYPAPDGTLHPDGKAYQYETTKFMEFAETYHFVVAGNFHGGEEVFNYPWDFTFDRPVDNEWWKFVGAEYALNAQNDSPSGYSDPNDNGTNDGTEYFDFLKSGSTSQIVGVTHGADWYQIDGGRQDYMNYELQCREVTVELSQTKTSPAESSSINYDILDLWNYNQEAYIEYLIQGTYGFRGVVKDIDTDAPLDARITIVGRDDQSLSRNSWVETELPLGDFYRPIEAGVYTILIEADADCYLPVTLNRTITNYQTIDLGDILLQKVTDTAPSNSPVTEITATTATLNWDNINGASNYSVRYREQGTTTWTSTSSNVNSLNITGLSVSTTYEFQINVTCSSNTSSYSNITNFTTLAANYCDSNGNDTYYLSMGRVQLNTIDNTTTGAGTTSTGYSNFTNMETSLDIGTQYTIILTPNRLSSYSIGYAAWIDYDNDSNFSSGEQIFNQTSTSNSSVSGSFTVPTGVSLASKRLRVSMKYNSTPKSCESFDYGEVEDYTINISHNATWTGATNNDWATATNWSPAIVPSATSDIIIPSAANISIGAHVSVSNLTIGSGAVLTVNEGVVLTNTGTITNSGSIVLKSSVTGTASLLSDSSVDNVTQERYLTSNQRGWRLLSNPLSVTTFGTLASNSLIDLGPNASGEYNSATNTWSSGVDSDNMVMQQAYKVFIRGLSSEVTGINYSVIPPNNVTIKTIGTASNTVPSSITTIQGQFYLIANPYTAPVSVSSIIAASTGLSSTVSYYDPTKASNGASELLVKKGGYNADPVSGTSGSASDVVIPPMGSIFVQAASAGSINIPKTAIYTGTIAGEAGNYNHKTTNTKNISSAALTINVNSDGVNFDKLQLRFKEVGTAGNNIDFGKLPNTILNIYSITEESKNLAVAELELKEQIIPLGIGSKVLQNFTFHVVENSIPAGFEAVLEDKLLNTKTILVQGTDYNFNIDNTTNSQGEERFSIALKPLSSLLAEDEVLDSVIKIWPNPAVDQFNILNNNSVDVSIQIFTMKGQLIETKKIPSGITEVIETHGWAAGVYMVKLTNNGTQIIKKLIIE